MHVCALITYTGKSSVEDRNQRVEHKYSLFDPKEWVQMGTDKTSGGNETVRTRRIACAKFSTLQPHLLMSAHPYPTDESAELDLKPYKVGLLFYYFF